MVTDRTSDFPEHPDLASYLLGTASPEERRAVERHLGHCSQCRTETWSLAATAAALALLSPADRRDIAAEFGVTGPPGRPGDPPHRTPRVRTIMTAVGLLALVLATLAAILAAAEPKPAGAAPTGPAGEQKYYVVGAPVNGQREYVYAIAVRTLGDGNRYREIVELNRGRRQADGAVFTDALDIRPGWVLLLPADARGPGVLDRPPSPALPAGDGPAATPGSPAGSRPAAGLDARQGPSAADQRGSRPGGIPLTGLVTVAAVLVVVGGAVLLARRVRARSTDDPADESQFEKQGWRRAPVPAMDGRHWTDDYLGSGVHIGDLAGPVKPGDSQPAPDDRPAGPAHKDPRTVELEAHRVE